MTHERTRYTPADLRAFAARGRLMLCELLVWIAEFFGNGRIGRAIRAGLVRDLSNLRRAAACIVTLLALPLVPDAPVRLGPRRAHRPPNAPAGFRRGRICADLRVAVRAIKAGRGVRGRIDALARVFDNLDAWIAPMVRRLERDAFVTAYVMVRAPVDACFAQACDAPAIADTS